MIAIGEALGCEKARRGSWQFDATLLSADFFATHDVARLILAWS